MPESVRHLSDRVAALVDANDADWGRALDGAGAALLAALGRFCDEPEATVPPQRALMMVVGKGDTQSADPDGLTDALKQVDADLGSERGGFSRLLESALTGELLIIADRLHVDEVEPGLRPLATILDKTGARLTALDDVAHALGLTAQFASGALVTECLMRLAYPDETVEARVDLGRRWLRERGVQHRLVELFGLLPAVVTLTAELIDVAAERGIAADLAMWVLADRIPVEGGLETEDRALLEQLLERAGLLPLEVFDAAQLWLTID